MAETPRAATSAARRVAFTDNVLMVGFFPLYGSWNRLWRRKHPVRRGLDLKGSECILAHRRSSINRQLRPVFLDPNLNGARACPKIRSPFAHVTRTVSYTHLTLPTSDLV